MLQRDEVNASRLETVVVIVLTSNKALASAPGNTLLPRKHTGLPMDCVANASQLATLNKDDLETLVGSLPRPLLEKVDAGVRWFLHLES